MASKRGYDIGCVCVCVSVCIHLCKHIHNKQPPLSGSGISALETPLLASQTGVESSRGTASDPE